MRENNLTAILVDDEPEAIKYFYELLEEHKEIRLLGSFTDPQKAITEINKTKPDILFLDVQMPVSTGFDVVKAIRTDNYLPHIIFTTGFEKFAIRAIKYAAFDYLLKPINPFELENVIQKISNLKEQDAKTQRFDRLFDNLQNNKPLKFNTCTGFIVIRPAEIIYLEASRNYCELYLINNRKELVTTSMNQIHHILSVKCFYRVSRSNIINLTFLQKVDRSKKVCYLEGDGELIMIPIPSGNIKELENNFTSQR